MSKYIFGLKVAFLNLRCEGTCKGLHQFLTSIFKSKTNIEFKVDKKTTLAFWSKLKIAFKVDIDVPLSLFGVDLNILVLTCRP